MSHFLEKFFDIPATADCMGWSEYYFALGHGAKGYSALYIGPGCIRLYAYPSTGLHCHLEVPGEVLEQVGTDLVFEYMHSLSEQGFDWRASRVDVAFDNVPFTPRQCYDAWLVRNIRTRAHWKSHKWVESADGNTFNFGSRKSGRFVRVYDRRGPTRFEVEFKGEWAERMGKLLLEGDQRLLATQSLGYVRDYIDFVDSRGGASNISRAPLLNWWAGFVGAAERIRIQREDKNEANLVMRMRDYFERLLPTLYVIRYGLGVSLDDAVETAGIRLTSRHRLKLKRLQEIRRGVIP